MTSRPISTFLELHGLSVTRSPEMRPMLARVLTDLFVQAPAAHHPGEVERFGTLLESLYDDLDRATRAAVASKLAERADAPFGLVLRMARDETKIAEPILARSAILTEPTLLGVLRGADPAKRAAIAGRANLGPEVVRHLSRDEHPTVLRTLVSNAAVRLSAAEIRLVASGLAGDRDAASALLGRPEAKARDLAPLFLTADTAGRAKILDAFIDEGAAFELRLQAKTWLAAATSTDLGTILVEHARNRRIAEMAEVLAQFLSLPRETADACLADDGGEPLVVALRALQLEDKPLLTLLLLVNPAIGRSVERIYALVKLSERLTMSAAERLITAAWRAEEEPVRAVYESVEAGAPARRLPAALRPGAAAPREVPELREERRYRVA